MPNVLQLLLDPASLVVFALYAGLILWEAIAPARPLPRVPGWRWRGLAAFAAYFLLSSYLPFLWADALAPYRLVDLSGPGTAEAAVAGVLAYEALAYVWHRSMHRFAWLWRGLHQMHHSAERLDTFSAFWFSPLDTAGWTALFSLALALVGLNAEASAWVLFATTFLVVFQHANLRTPRWIGYVVQRPESHSHHHERGAHARNYADLPVFDLLLGTFHNPEDFADATGFYEGASRRVLDMLAFRDVSEPPGRHRS